MAKGISNRTRLSLPQASDEARAMANTLERWGNNLPFAHTGFMFWRTTNETALGAGLTREITWNQVVMDHENWMPAAGTVQSIVVPQGLSGWYQLQLDVYWVNAATPMFPFIRVNGQAITFAADFAVAVSAGTVSALRPLNDGDLITAGLVNGSAAPQTITSGAGDPTNDNTPTLTATRVALL